MKMLTIHDKEFTEFGKVITSPFTEFFARQAESIKVPEFGVSYLPSVGVLESPEALKYYYDYFGELPIQIGYCWGRNNVLNCLEWHKSSEVHVALEDMVLMLGNFLLMDSLTFDTKNIKMFYARKGESVEIFQSTLHFCPAMSGGKVFKNVVILPKETNTPLDYPTDDKTLVAKNKWLICHLDATKQVALGRVIGIKGKNVII